MSSYYYYDSDGTKQGPIDSVQVRDLARSGVITPETMVETNDGRRGIASKIHGLEFVRHEDSVQTDQSHHLVVDDDDDMYWYYDKGVRHGPCSELEMRQFAILGLITQSTRVERAAGIKFNASKIKNIVFHLEHEYPSDAQSVPVRTEVPIDEPTRSALDSIHTVIVTINAIKWIAVLLCVLAMFAGLGLPEGANAIVVVGSLFTGISTMISLSIAAALFKAAHEMIRLLGQMVSK